MFATDSAYGDLLVVVVPQEGPKLIGARSRYFLGENISINCTSSPTLPPANLTFYINQKLVSIINLNNLHHPIYLIQIKIIAMTCNKFFQI